MAINKRGDKYVVDYWDAGKRYRKHFDRQHDARDFSAKVRNDKRLGTHVAADRVPLFKEAAAAWLAAHADRAEASYDQYANHVTHHLLSRFGDKRLDQISHQSITEWRAELARTGGTSKWHRPMARNTIRAIVRVLSSILDHAVRNGQLARNPADLLAPQYTRAKVGQRDEGAVQPDEILNADEIRQLVAVTDSPLYRTLFMAAAGTGAREGELFALRWSDVTFDDKPCIAIRRSLSWAKGPVGKRMARFGPPKTDAGVRDVTIDQSLVHALKIWKMRAERNEHNLVFADHNGKPMDRSVLLKCGFWPALKRAGLKRVKFHSLRHSHASGMIMHGAPITEVAARLGHSDPGITLKVYSHWFKDADSGAAGRYATELFAIDTK